MKALLCVSLLVVLSISCVAQFNTSLLAINSSLKTSPLLNEFAINPYYYKVEPMPPGYRMKSAGTMLVIGGSILTVAGLVISSNSNDNVANTRNPNASASYVPASDLAPVLIVGGIGMIVPGIIFWVKGAKRYNRFKADQERSSSLQIKVKGSRAALVYQF